MTLEDLTKPGFVKDGWIKCMNNVNRSKVYVIQTQEKKLSSDIVHELKKQLGENPGYWPDEGIGLGYVTIADSQWEGIYFVNVVKISEPETFVNKLLSVNEKWEPRELIEVSTEQEDNPSKKRHSLVFEMEILDDERIAAQKYLGSQGTPSDARKYLSTFLMQRQ